MNDPWTEIRELFPTFEGQPETGSEIRRLLADADALLAVKKVADIALIGIQADVASRGPMAGFVQGTNVLIELEKVLAALSENLR